MANDRRVGNLLVQMRAEIGGLKTDIKELEKSFQTGFTGIQNSAATAFKNVGTSIAAAFSVTAVIGFGKSIIDLGGRLKDLEEQTQISAQLLSGMKSTLEENGTSVEAFAKGISIAQRNLGQIDSDTDKAAVAIERLGLNLDELRNVSSEEFLKQVSEALAKIPNQYERAARAAALFGKNAQELIPVILKMAGSFEELRKKGLSQADIDLLDEAGDAWTRFSNQFTVAVAKMVSQDFRDLNNLFDKFAEIRFRLSSLGAFLSPEAVAGGFIGARAGQGALKAMEDETLKAKGQFTGLGTGKAEKAGKTPKEIKIELEHLRDGFSDLEESAFKASQAMIPVFEQLKNLSLTPFERQLAEINDRFDEMAVKIRTFGEATRQDITPFLEDLEFSRSQELLKLQPDEDLWDLPDTMTAKVKESKGAWDDLFVSVGSGLQSTLDGIIRGTQTWGETWRAMLANIATSAARALSENLIKGLAETDSGNGGGKGLSIGLGLLKMAGSAVSAYFGGGGGAFSSMGSGGMGGMGDFDFAGSFALGGVVPGRIGEPRMAMVHGGETITPSNRMGEMNKPNVKVSINGSIIPNPGVTRDQVIQIGVEQFRTRSSWTQMMEARSIKR